LKICHLATLLRARQVAWQDKNQWFRSKNRLFVTKTILHFGLSEHPSETTLLNKHRTHQGCQMVYFQTKNPNLGKFSMALQWKMLVCFMESWSILRPLDIIYGFLDYFMVIWYIFYCVGKLYQEKSGNPGTNIVLRGKY
jgi:hypothetical protein